jgi:hydrogenase expression/formation protein HypD
VAVASTLRSAAAVARLARLVERLFREVRARLGLDRIKVMDFCGTHEWTVTHYGLRALMPPNIELVSGPGCPVCVTPSYYIEVAVKLALEGVRIYTYGDVYRLPALKAIEGARCLADAKALGGDVRVVYSFLDAVKMAREDGRESIFFAIGFETLAPIYAELFRRGEVLENLKFLSTVKLTPPAAKYAVKLNIERGLLPLKGVIAPGHVSTVIGACEWEFLPRDYGLATVVAGFEPIDVLIAIAEILRMILDGRPAVKVEYRRVASWEGNKYAKKLIYEVFRAEYSAWRGIGMIPRSGFKLREEYHERYDALKAYGIPDLAPEKFIFTQAHYGVPWSYDLPPQCRCGEVIMGISKPTDCPLYLKSCTPDRPIGPCMVGQEATCSIWARHGGPIELGRGE